MTHPTIPAAEHAHSGGSIDRANNTRRADELKPGDWVAELVDGDPWAPKRRDAEILFARPYTDDVKNARVLLVAQVAGESGPDTERPLADTPMRLLTEAERDAMRERAERAQKIAAIREFADWMEASPAIPMPWQIQADEHLSIGDGTEVERLAKVRQVAALLGVEVDERLADRTGIKFKVGGFVEYSLLAWHKDGRPAEPSKVVFLRQDGTAVDVTPEPAEDLGFGYSREDDDPQVVRPHSPRVPLHTGGVVDGGQLVDETPVELTDAGLTPAADASRGPLAGTTPVVTYFTRGRGYVTVVAPTYDACRDAMFAKYGDRWGLSYLAGMQRSTYAVRGYPEREVIIAPGVDPVAAEKALTAAAALLVAEPLVHLEVAGAKTMCGLPILDLPSSEPWTNDHTAVTCKACIDEVPF